MSASREKKKRQEFLASGAVDPKAARAAEQKAAERRSNILYCTVAVIFVVVAAALLVYNSGIIQRSQTAVTIDGQKYTVPQAAYYYQQVCNNYGSMFGQEYLQTLKTQSYDEEQTWDDYFKSEAINTMKYIHAATKAAAEAGTSLDSEDEATIKVNVDSMKSAAATAGYSYGAYLKAVYGATMTGSVFESCLRDQLLASKYASNYSEENFVYSEDEILAYYNENKNSYDIVDGEYVTVNGAPEAKTDADGNAVERTEEEKTAAMEAAREKAGEIQAAVKAGGSLEAQADGESVTYSGSVSSSSGVQGTWFFDEARKAGDLDVIEDASGSRVYVALFKSRERDEALDYNVRHILVSEANLELPEGEEASDEQIKAKADEILAGWDGTEDGFAKLANEYSQDGGSNTTGGLYENVNKGTMVTEFENWCYEDGRKSGDTGIVKTNYGYHIMYFVGYGDTQYWHQACESELRSAASGEWQQSLIDSVTAEPDEAGMKNI